MAEIVNIFEVIDSSPKDYFKFVNVGDQVQGTYIYRNDNSFDGYNNPQTLVDLLQTDGTVKTVSIRHNKIGLLKELDNIKLGQIIGFTFTGIKENVGKAATKYIRVVHDPKYVNEEWLKEYKAKQAKFENPTAEISVNELFQEATPAPAPAPTTDVDKIKAIADLAKAKLGATSSEEVKAKVVEKTGMELTSLNLDLILEKLKAL